MTLEDYNTLYEVLNERRRESEELKVRIEEHHSHIMEAGVHLKAIEGLETEDRNIFSPRKADILYKEEIRKIKEEKYFHEERSRSFQERKTVVDCQVAKLTTVLEHQKKDSFAFSEETQSQYKKQLKDLKEIIDRIEYSSAFIEKNPIQARQDFLIIAKSLREIVDRLRETME